MRPMKSNRQPSALAVGLAASFVLGVGALSLPAETWIKYEENKHVKAYYDANSIRMVKNLRYLWTKWEYAIPEYKDYAKGVVAISHYYVVIDCSSRMEAMRQWVHYDREGTLLDRGSSQGQAFRAMTPGTIGDILVNTFCSPATQSEEVPRTDGRQEAPRTDRGQEKTEHTSSVGSGFVVSSAGMLLTNAHVVSGCEVIRVTTAGAEQRTASLVAVDPQSDLALLRSEGAFSSVASFRVGRPIRLGEEIVALGYPLHGLLASGVNVSTGTVSALAGLANDSTRVQISAPVQPGNSGGPVLDLSGAVVGIVVSKLDALRVAKAIGDIPQNVNFAIKGDVARLFLEGHGVSLQSAHAGWGWLQKKEDAAEKGREFTVLVECLKGQDAK